MQPAMTNPADRRAKKRNSHIYIRKPYIEAFYLVPFVVRLDFRVPSVARGCDCIVPSRNIGDEFHCSKITISYRHRIGGAS